MFFTVLLYRNAIQVVIVDIYLLNRSSAQKALMRMIRHLKSRSFLKDTRKEEQSGKELGAVCRLLPLYLHLLGLELCIY